MPSETIELRGHIIDTGVLTRVLDVVLSFGGEYKISDMQMGHATRDKSFARITIDAKSARALSSILEQVTRLGVVLTRQPEVRFEAAPKAGVFPDDFYATTNLPTSIFKNEKWIHLDKAEMDCGIVLDPRTGKPRCLRMHHVLKGSKVAVGHEGIRVEPLSRTPAGTGKNKGDTFEFMSSEVSSEKPKLLVIRQIARSIKEAKKAGQKIIVVGGPAIIHTGAGPHLEALIHAGYVDVLFGGNAIAAHDIEADMFGTSLGVSLTSGKPVEHGHEHHLRAINRVRRAGSIAAAVQKKWIKRGVMHACVKNKTPFVLVGSIRDDGPLPDVIIDMPDAQDAMREHIPGTGVALLIGTMLLSIAVGNMLPATVRTVCVDINPAVVTKLADRGTSQAVGLVTDAELFLRSLANELGVKARKGS